MFQLLMEEVEVKMMVPVLVVHKRERDERGWIRRKVGAKTLLVQSIVEAHTHSLGLFHLSAIFKLAPIPSPTITSLPWLDSLLFVVVVLLLLSSCALQESD